MIKIKIILYSTVDSENVINKKKIYRHEYNISLKDTTNIHTPTIVLKVNPSDYMTTVNYCYIDDLERYYFINDIEVMSNNLVKLHMECDVIETYKEQILTSPCELERVIKKGDFLDVNVKSQVIKEIDIYNSDVEIEQEFSTILTTIGE